jgi:DNA end-binding protein Ku
MANLKSSISFGLVNIPIEMNPIIKNNDTSFNQLHVKCKHRINYIKYCSHCKKEVKNTDIIKGFQYEKDKYVFFSKDELLNLKPSQDKEIEIVSFVKLSEIDPMYFEKSYVLSPVGKGRAYSLFCEAINKCKMVALAKTVIGSKFYYVILRFFQSRIIMTTLFFEEEIKLPNSELQYKVDSKELELAVKLINELKGKFEPDKYNDEYQDNIRKAIDDKLDGKVVKKKKAQSKKRINDLMEALEKSLK